jgi:rhodanese-related sulfurtransferase
LLLTGCRGQQAAPVIPPDLDTYEGLRAALAEGHDILVLDVRTPAETEAGMIPGAVNIPHTELPDSLTKEDRDRVIVVYCQSGGRSFMAFETLAENGFDYVFDFGSVLNWQGDLQTE